MDPGQDEVSGGSTMGAFTPQIMTALGGLAAISGSIFSGQAQKRISQFNADYASQQKLQALQSGGYQATVRQAEAQILEAKTRSRQAAGGTVINAGSNAAVIGSQERGNEMDQLMINTMASRRAYGFGVQATDDTMRGKLAEQASFGSSVSSILSTAGQEWLEADPTYDPRFGRGLNLMVSGR